VLNWLRLPEWAMVTLALPLNKAAAHVLQELLAKFVMIYELGSKAQGKISGKVQQLLLISQTN
jgi:hypothetical protein